MLEFGNRSRSARRRRLAEQRQSSLPSRPRRPLSNAPDSTPRSPSNDAQRRRMYAAAEQPLRLTPRPSPSPTQSPTSNPLKIRRSPSAFTHRLGSMGMGRESAPANRPPGSAPDGRRPRSSSPGEPTPLPPSAKSAKSAKPAKLSSDGDRSAPAASARRSASTSRTAASARRISDGAAPSDRRETPVRRKTRAGSAFLYTVRTIILVVGLGAIAGTLLSALNPSGQVADASQQTVRASNTSAIASASESSSTLGLANVFNTYRGRELTTLKQEILGMSDLYSGLTPGVFMLDLDTGNTVDINGEVAFAAASMIKVPVLVAFFQDVDAGRIRLDEVLTLEEEDLAEGSGEMQFDGVGTEYTALETATLMIIISDNTATNILIRRMGGMEVLNERFRSWGLQQTTLRNLLPDLEGTNTTTPKELAGLMAMVSQGDLVSLRSRDRLLDIMRRTYTDTLIPAGVGDPEATIAHKTGDIGELVGDTGLVDMPNGKRYAITTLMKRSFNDDRAQEWIRQINSMIYADLTENPTSTLFDSSGAATPSDDTDPAEDEASGLEGTEAEP